MRDTHSNSLGWLLDQELGTVEGVRYAVLMSSDGLLRARTETISQDDGEKFAALTAALRAAGKAWDEFTGGEGMRQLLIESVGCIGLTTTAAKNTMLSVCTTGPDADVGLISHHMVRLASRVGHEMTTADRLPTGEGGSPA
ncbi:roadblock/LC7 domain-containing protein [Streptomyces sp. NBC_01549]|uniref:roadblock/LC7 domain-containing protein n=1 Tax=unclassified Streptomyces TaxID=2593676 RepID=UPI00225A5687|nr:roadblock/LC7 domain-containing protein [Streptomyces sp. NBC_01549]MCX4597499.1 roadblock/LC7 domain-containing protein [Streptomyces sp. NBC_01549]